MRRTVPLGTWFGRCWTPAGACDGVGPLCTIRGPPSEKEVNTLRYSYDWVAVLVGAILIVSPDVGRFVQGRAALSTNVVAGIVLLV